MKLAKQASLSSVWNITEPDMPWVGVLLLLALGHLGWAVFYALLILVSDES